ncbi:MAG: GntR family transcriptional regulator [Oscillospiraceae bacterium]|nr:GntR family transcriptional regulator [Oscillospiraceae bacterium]
MKNSRTATPMYIQLAEQLEEDINNKIYADGEKLPSENQLCEKYGVSRITIRRALEKLEEKNLLFSVHGKGTYVQRKKISQNLTKITSFEKTLEEKGLTGYTEVEHFSKSRIPANIRQIFGQDNVHRLCLVGYAGDMPLVYYNSYLKSYVAERMYPLAKRWESQKKAFSTWDMYKDIEIRYLRMEQKITATIADSHIAKILHLPKGDPVIRVETYAYEKNMVVEYKIAYYRADKYSFNIVREVDNGV